MYKLVATDMDGTLLNSHGELSEENIKALRQAIDKGVKIVFTTGRGIRAITKFINALGFNEREEYVITNNGVSLYNSKTLECLKVNALKGQDLKFLCELGLEFGAKIHVYDYPSEGCVILEENEFAAFERKHIGMPVFIEPDFCLNIIKDNRQAFKVLYLGSEELLDDIQNKIPKYIYEKFAVVRSLPIVLEIFNKDCNKGNAVRDLGKMLNISKDEIIAIGDQQNDFEMIKFAGMGVAMGNAIGILKEVANYITDTNDNNGVAKVINKFVL